MASSNAVVQTVSDELHAVPLTLEGLSVLHQMFRFRWAEWRKLDEHRQPTAVAGDTIQYRLHYRNTGTTPLDITLTDQLLEQTAVRVKGASVIPDGFHLPDSLIRVILKVKSPARTVITCDASSLAGLPPGRYREWDTEFEVQAGGKVVVPGTPFLAGSGVFTDACIPVVMRAAGVSPKDAIDMASARPRELLGLPAWELTAGCSTPLVRFDWEPGGAFAVREVIGR